MKRHTPSITVSRWVAGVMFVMSSIPFIHAFLSVLFVLASGASLRRLSEAFQHFVWASVPLALSLILWLIADIVSNYRKQESAGQVHAEATSKSASSVASEASDA